MDEWHSIRDLAIGNIGSTIDVKDDKRLYKSIELCGIHIDHELVEERVMTSTRPMYVVGPPYIFQLSHPFGTISLSMDSQWRYSGA